MTTSPAKFIAEVKQEARKVTWPTRKETMASTMMVFVMAVIAAIYFFVVDWAFSSAVKALLGI